MTDKIVVNRALNLLGVNPIATLDDATKAARIMKGLLTETKKVVLNEFPWAFAMRIEPLVPKGAGSGGYAYRFAYPEKVVSGVPVRALAVYRVYSDTDFRGVAEFRVIGDDILANIATGSVEYIDYVEDVSKWPVQVMECLVHRLASDAAVQLTGSAQLMSGLLEKYMMLARAASQTSVVEENVPPLRATDYIDARR